MSVDMLIVNGDISLDQDGAPVTIKDNLKLEQDVKKIAVTEQGTNRFHPWYGNAVGLATVGKTNHVFSTLRQSASATLEQSLANLILLQRHQRQSQIVTPQELILSVRDVNIEQDMIDPRQINISFTVLTEALEELTNSLAIIT
jgi:hypothetical protein